MIVFTNNFFYEKDKKKKKTFHLQIAKMKSTRAESATSLGTDRVRLKTKNKSIIEYHEKRFRVKERILDSFGGSIEKVHQNEEWIMTGTRTQD